MNNHSKPEHGQITLKSDGYVSWICFDNPARMNALNTSMWEALPKKIAAAEKNENVRAIVFRGGGERAFSAGADISEFGTARTGAASRRYDELNHNAFNAVMNCAKPTIAMVQGFCMGGGMEIALCCDLRLSSGALGVDRRRLLVE